MISSTPSIDRVLLFDKLLKWHRKWNDGSDWFLGSHCHGSANYWIDSWQVSAQRLTRLTNPGCVAFGRAWPHHKLEMQSLLLQHENLLLEATWLTRTASIKTDSWLTWIPELNLRFKQVEFAGDISLFDQMLTEWQLWASLTESGTVP